MSLTSFITKMILQLPQHANDEIAWKTLHACRLDGLHGHRALGSLCKLGLDVRLWLPYKKKEVFFSLDFESLPLISFFLISFLDE